MVLVLLLVHLLERLLDLVLGHVALADADGAHLLLRLLDEVEVGALHHDLPIGVAVNEHLVGVGLVARLDGMDALPQVSLLLLMEAFLVVLVAKVVHNRLPLLDEGESGVLHVAKLSLAMRIERDHLGNLGILKDLAGDRKVIKNLEHRLNNLRKRERAIRVLVNPVSEDVKAAEFQKLNLDVSLP